MQFETKKQLIERVRYTNGLIEVLKCDIDILRKDTSDCNLVKIRESIREADKTVQKLHLVVGEMGYILKLDKEESRIEQTL